MGSIRVGDVEVTRIEEVHFPGLPPSMWYPEFDEGEWQAHRHLLTEDDWDTGAESLVTHMQSWLLDVGGRKIIIDTGVGNDKSRPGFDVLDHMHTDYLDLLAQAGMAPEQVDLVIQTHVHMDHVGWNTRLVDDEWVPTFPNARYVIPRADLEFWDPANAGRHERKGDAFMSGVFADSIAPLLTAGVVDSWDGEYVIDAGVRLEAAPGHTPGTSVVKLASRGEQGVFIGDMMHSPVQIPLPHWNSCFCEDPDGARESRRKVLGWAADEGALIFAGHYGADRAAEVRREGSTFTLKSWKGFREGS